MSRKIPSDSGWVTFPELKEAEKSLIGMPLEKGRRLIRYGDEKKAFGDKLKNPQFRSQLRKLQEKYKISVSV